MWALKIISFIIGSPYFDCKKIEVNELKFFYKIEKNSDLWHVIDIMAEKLVEHNTITLHDLDNDTIAHEMNNVIYVQDPRFPSEYFLEKQLDEWEELARIKDSL